MGYGLAGIAGRGFLLSSSDEVDFMIHAYKNLTIFGQEVSINTTHVTTVIVWLTLVILALIARRSIMNGDPDKPTGIQNIVEMFVEFLDGMVNNSMGKHAPKYANYILTLMSFIFLSNISGLFGLRPPTADYGTTFGLAIITFVLIQYAAIKTSKFAAFTDLFKPIPLLFPINLIGEFATPLSLSLRLFGNVMAGTIMLALWYGLLPWFAKIGLPVFLHGYFDLFSGAIQTYVFSMLTMVFITDKLNA